MKTKFILLLITALLVVSLTACNTATRSAVDNESAGLPSDQTNEVSEPSVNDISDESAEAEPQDTETSDQTDETPSADEPAERNTSSQNTEPANKTDTPQGNNQSQSPQPSQPNNPQTPSNPPTTSQPPTTTPPRTEPTTPSEPPATPEPPKQLPPEGVLYSDFKDDEHGILQEIHNYAVSKGFILDNALDMDAGYNGRPNLNDLSAERVKEALKYHVDLTHTLHGPAHFRVVFWNYQGKIEYIFLWQ